MKYWEFLQSGDEDQCRDNGLEGSEYCFALRQRTELKRSNGGYTIHGIRFGVSLDRDYTTSFKLTLTFEEAV